MRTIGRLAGERGGVMDTLVLVALLIGCASGAPISDGAAVRAEPPAQQAVEAASGSPGEAPASASAHATRIDRIGPAPELLACASDSDCTTAAGDCCGCTGGGTGVPVAKAHVEEWRRQVAAAAACGAEHACPAVISGDWECHATPRCDQGRCTLAPSPGWPKPAEPGTGASPVAPAPRPDSPAPAGEPCRYRFEGRCFATSAAACAAAGCPDSCRWDKFRQSVRCARETR